MMPATGADATAGSALAVAQDFDGERRAQCYLAQLT